MSHRSLFALLIVMLAGAAIGAAPAEEKSVKTEVKPETKITGRVYADFSVKRNQDDATGVKTTDSGAGIDVKRFYLGVAHTFNAGWSAAITLDIGDKGNASSCSIRERIDVDADGTPDSLTCSAKGGDNKRYDVFVKNAYLQYQVGPEAIFRFGAASLPWVSYAEGLYGMRYLEHTVIDRVKVGDSADWGVHFLGQVADGGVKYALSAINGRGYSDPARSKSLDFEGRLGFEPLKGLNLGVGAYSGKRGLDAEPQTPGGSSPAKNTASRFNALVAYEAKLFKVGVERFSAKNWFNVLGATAADESDGVGFWGGVNVAPTVQLFARYDTVKISKNLNPDLKDNYVNAGVQWKANKALTLALAYKSDKVDTGALAGVVDTQNGRIGSTRPSSSGKYGELGVFAQYSF